MSAYEDFYRRWQASQQLPESLPCFHQDWEEYPPPYLILLIQAGHAALGYVQEGELVLHKVITRYMVRGNGRAQIGYLKTRGKSKAGSRVRLSQSLDFIEAINEKIEEWAVLDDCEFIFHSASIQLWQMLFSSKVPCPFDKKDPRLRSIALDVQVPNLEELHRVQAFLQGENV